MVFLAPEDARGGKRCASLVSCRAMHIEQIEEADATGEVAAFYADFRATLRASFVPTVFRSLARHPAWLLPAWRALGPNLATAAAEEGAAALRRACADRLDAIVAPGAPPRLEGAAGEEIRAVLETFAYVIPKAWLAVTALREALEGRPLPGAAPADRTALPRGVPARMPAIPLLPEAPDDPRVRAIFEAARERMGRPAVPSLYRTLGRWPAYLAAVWERVIEPGPLAGYRAAVPGLIGEAARAAHALPHPLALAGPASDGVAGILAVYQRNMPETLLQILRLLGDLCGRAAARGPLGVTTG